MKNSIGIDTGCDSTPVWVVPPALRQLAECGDAELVEELIAIFQTDTASRLEVLRRAVAAADYATVLREAHTIKGSALQVGANRLADLCRQTELEAHKSPPRDLAPPLSRLLQSFAEVCGVIAQRRKFTGKPDAPVTTARDGSHAYGE